MKFKIELQRDSDNTYTDSVEVEAWEDSVEITLDNPERVIKMKISELRYALAFSGDEK